MSPPQCNITVSRSKSLTLSTNPTIRQIARQTGVSVATVSRVLNNKPGTSTPRETVLRPSTQAAIAHGMGPPAASRLRSSMLPLIRSRCFAGYDADLASGVYAAVVEQHMQLAISDLTQKAADENYTQFFLRNHIDGVVLRVTGSSRQIASHITQEGFPCVVVSDRFDGEPISYVDYDSRTGMARAMDYLFELGHLRIGFVINALGNDTDHRDRQAAYAEGLQRHQIDYDRLVSDHDGQQQPGRGRHGSISSSPWPIRRQPSCLRIRRRRSAGSEGLCSAGSQSPATSQSWVMTMARYGTRFSRRTAPFTRMRSTLGGWRPGRLWSVLGIDPCHLPRWSSRHYSK